jgi:hypothetical protein
VAVLRLDVGQHNAAVGKSDCSVALICEVALIVMMAVRWKKSLKNTMTIKNKNMGMRKNKNSMIDCVIIIWIMCYIYHIEQLFEQNTKANPIVFLFRQIKN